MKIYTLGTSHGDATVSRFHSSVLYEIGENLYLADCGEPVTALMIRKGFDFDRLKAVWITHMHSDHMGGLPALLKHIFKHRKAQDRVSVFLPEASAPAAISEWLGAMHIGFLEAKAAMAVIHPGEIYADGAVSVSAVATRHMDYLGAFPSYAFDLRAGEKRVLHTGDLKGDFSDFPRVAQSEPFDLCLCEATHYRMKDALPALKTAKIKRMVFIHIMQRYHFERGEALLFGECRALPYPVSVAHDGDVFFV